MGQKLDTHAGEDGEKSIVMETMRNMTQDDFHKKLNELNAMAQQYLKNSSTKVRFVVRKGTDTSVFWKATVEIACFKLKEPMEVQTYRLLNLKEFIQAYTNLKCQCSAMEQTDESSSSSQIDPSLTASSLFSAQIPKTQNDSQDSCIICYERKPDVSLPCTHNYCLQCIEEWNEDHDTCPVCREQVESPEDTWLLPDVPKAEEINSEIQSTFLNLAEDNAPECSPS